MTKTAEDYFEAYRQKLQKIAEHERAINDIKLSAESAIRQESDAVEKLQRDLRQMRRIITTAVETGKDITEILLGDTDDGAFTITIWDHDDPLALANDTQIEYTHNQLEDLKHRIRKSFKHY